MTRCAALLVPVALLASLAGCGLQPMYAGGGSGAVAQGDLADGEIMIDATAGSDAGIDVVSSEFATIAAEQTALENLAVEVADRIVTRLTLTLRAQS